jgi:hypothetical protein
MAVREPDDVAAAEINSSARGPIQATQQVEQCGFSSTRLSRNGYPFPSIHLKREVIKNNKLRPSRPIYFAKTVRLDRTICAQTPAFTFRLEQAEHDHLRL